MSPIFLFIFGMSCLAQEYEYFHLEMPPQDYVWFTKDGVPYYAATQDSIDWDLCMQMDFMPTNSNNSRFGA